MQRFESDLGHLQQKPRHYCIACRYAKHLAAMQFAEES
mgnify:CR=1 FL=1